MYFMKFVTYVLGSSSNIRIGAGWFFYPTALSDNNRLQPVSGQGGKGG
jgi:hypothetical protein